MPKVISYLIVRTAGIEYDSMETHVTSINSWIESGWQPVGGCVIVPNGNRTPDYYTTMVIYETPFILDETVFHD